MDLAEKKLALFDAHLSHRGLQHLVDVAAELLGNPLFMADMSMGIVCKSSNMGEGEQDFSAEGDPDRQYGLAKQAADAAVGAAREEAKAAQDEAVLKAGKEVADYGQRIQSQIGMRQRQTLLRAKQDMIAEVLEEAYQKLLKAPDASYFTMILNLAEKNIQSGKGEILFNAKDLKRLPADLQEKLAALAKAKGGQLTISKEAADIDGGFILRYRPDDVKEDPDLPDSTYGAVEQNCSLSSLIAEKKDELSDLVYQNLF